MPEGKPIRVLIADDHAVVREGIRHVLGPEQGFEVVGEASDGEQVVQLAGQLAPDVIVMDISMPGRSGLGATQAICERNRDARVLVLSIHEAEEYVARSVSAGARGYLRKDSSPAELRNAVRALHEGRQYFTRAQPRPIADATPTTVSAEMRARLDQLTSRERDILAGIAAGLSNKEIAASRKISQRTVESHRESLMRKLGLRGAAALTRFAIEAGVVPTERSS